VIVEVALNLPLQKTFDYSWPEELDLDPVPGLRVLVPFSRRKMGGVITSVKNHSDFSPLRKVEKLIEDTPSMTEEILELSRWVASYYFCSWGEVLNGTLPGGMGLLLRLEIINKSNFLPGIERLGKPFQEIVKNKTRWTEEEWNRKKPGTEERKQLAEWLQKGLLEKVQIFAGQRSRPKMERWVRFLKSDESNRSVRKKTKKIQILDRLAKNNECSWEEIRNTVPNPAQALKNLEKEGCVQIFEKRVFRRFLEDRMPPIESFQQLKEDQQNVFQEVGKNLQEEKYKTYLLEGVTGSGKTEVYLHAVRLTQELGKSSLVLVPEISLTPLLVNRFRSRFGDAVAVLHSGMDDGERYDEWSRVRNGLSSIVVGARSAVFAPLKNLGLVIVDEEHDVSYKQGETPRYHARDVAVYRGFKAKATVLLGSATPSLESSYNVQLGKYHPLYLKKRIFQPTLPEVRLINLKHCDRQKGSPFFSIELLDAIRQRLLKKEQTLIFLNRRGFAPLMICGECNETHTCPNCSLSLVFHQAVGGLKCHHCDYFLITPQKCPACDSSESPKIVGSGTEQIETELKNIYPNAEVLRMDRDSLHGKHALSKMQRRIHDQEVDIVVGTQLITKGHDFPNVTLVGVILADLSLNLPDFRSGERTFQLLTQVAGRAGRAEKPGEVLIQTYNPKHHSLQCAKDHDTLRYLEIELKQRNLLKIPPFLSMVLILCSSPSEKRAETLAFSVRNRFKKLPPSLTVIGPVESPLKKLRNRYRWQVLIKAPDASMLKCQLNRLMKEPLKLQKDELLQIDIDPHHLI